MGAAVTVASPRIVWAGAAPERWSRPLEEHSEEDRVGLCSTTHRAAGDGEAAVGGAGGWGGSGWGCGGVSGFAGWAVRGWVGWWLGVGFVAVWRKAGLSLRLRLCSGLRQSGGHLSR